MRLMEKQREKHGSYHQLETCPAATLAVELQIIQIQTARWPTHVGRYKFTTVTVIPIRGITTTSTIVLCGEADLCCEFLMAACWAPKALKILELSAEMATRCTSARAASTWPRQRPGGGALLLHSWGFLEGVALVQRAIGKISCTLIPNSNPMLIEHDCTSLE